MKKIILFALVCAAAIFVMAQVPTPPSPTGGPLGQAGIFPFQNGGTIQMTSDADYTLTYPQTSGSFIKFTSSVSLTATRNIPLPTCTSALINFTLGIENSTTGGQELNLGPGVPVANGLHGWAICDGTSYISAGTSLSSLHVYGNAVVGGQMLANTISGAAGNFIVDTSGDATMSTLQVDGQSNLLGGVQFAAFPSVNCFHTDGSGNITAGCTITPSEISAIAANTFLANTSSSSAAPAAASIPSCSGTGNALTYASGTGLGCGTFATAFSYPGAGIANSTGSAWGTSYSASNSIPDNFLSSNVPLKNASNTFTGNNSHQGQEFFGSSNQTEIFTDGGFYVNTATDYFKPDGSFKASSIIDDGLSGTSPICANGVGNAFTTSGCSGAGSVIGPNAVQGSSGPTGPYTLAATNPTTTLNSLPMFEYQNVPRPNLATWLQSFHNCANQVCRIHVFGDSFAANCFPNSNAGPTLCINRWAEVLRLWLQNIYGSHGTGVVPVSAGFVLSGSTQILNSIAWSSTGTIDFNTGTLGPSQPSPAAENGLVHLSNGAVLTYNDSRNIPWDTLNVYYMKTSSSGSIAVSIDGGAVTGTISGTTGSPTANLYTLVDGTLATHTVTFTSTGDTYIYAAEGQAGTTGVSIDNMAQGGARAILVGNTPSTQMVFSDLTPGGVQASIEGFYTNDAGGGSSETVTDYTTYLTNIANHEIALGSNMLLEMPPVSINLSGTSNATTFTQAVVGAYPLGLCATLAVACINIQDSWGLTYSNANSLWMTGTGVGTHPNDKGNLDIANQIFRSLVNAVPPQVAGTQGYAFFSNGQYFGQDKNFFWDSTNHRLGIGTQTPTQALDIGTGKMTGGTNSGTERNIFDLSASSGFGASTITFPNSGQFFMSEVSLIGTNDILNQLIPGTTSGYGIVNAFNAAGLTLGTSGTPSSPIIFRPHGVNKMELYPSGGLSLQGTLADPGAYNLTIDGSFKASSIINTGATTLGSSGQTTVDASGNITMSSTTALLSISNAGSNYGLQLGSGTPMRDSLGNSGKPLQAYQPTLGEGALWVVDADGQGAVDTAHIGYASLIDSSTGLTVGGSVTATNIQITATQTTVSCSTSGTAIFSQPEQGSSDKKVLIHMTACLGTASYTYPTAFTNTPSVYASNNVAASIATTVSTTAVTVTGATSTGSLILEDY